MVGGHKAEEHRSHLMGSGQRGKTFFSYYSPHNKKNSASQMSLKYPISI